MATPASQLTVTEQVALLTNPQRQCAEQAQDVLGGVVELPVYSGKYFGNQASHFAFNWRDATVAGPPNTAEPTEIGGWYGPTGGPPATRRADPGAQGDLSDIPAGSVAVGDALGALVLSARALNDNDDWEWRRVDEEDECNDLRVLRPRCRARGFDDDGALVFGEDNRAEANGSAAIAGEDNRVRQGAEQSVAVGGECNQVGAWGFLGRWTSRAAAVAGISNRVEFENSAVIAGADNSVRANNSGSLGGVCNTIDGDFCEGGIPEGSAVVGGFGNHVGGSASAAVASTGSSVQQGSGNSLVAASEETTVGGRNAAASAALWSSAIGDRVALAGVQSCSAAGADNFIGGSFNCSSDQNAQRSAVLASEASVANGIRSAVVAGIDSTATGQTAYAGGSYARASGDTTFAWGNGASTQTTTAQGGASVAIGRKILATNSNSMTLGFGNPATNLAAATNGFQGLFPGGFEVFTNDALSSGFRVTSGSSSFGSICQRQNKEHITPVDRSGLLDQALNLPLYTYNYVGNDAEQRAVGPIADEYFARFGPLLGAKKDQTVVENFDFSSITLAALQGLAHRLDVLVRNTRRAAGLADVLPGDEDLLPVPPPVPSAQEPEAAAAQEPAATTEEPATAVAQEPAATEEPAAAVAQEPVPEEQAPAEAAPGDQADA